ncbi:AbfB domain-containing protein [Archangium violaceum]|uniref:AbfB domain-containing protein n=1 Tax=Archangium violaceum TaxID=83451 RepID=UPI001EEFE582|nr:AbfB domain-containing protein [Archangium violaceum]
MENEINGILTYDRAVVKPDAAQVRAVHDTLIAASRQLNNQGPLPLNQYRSLQVVTPGYTDRCYVRHADSLGATALVSATSSGTLKQDATFKIVAGLAEGSCYSFESRNYPGRYLRHANSRIRNDARDGSALFDQDATFCAQPGRAGSGVSFESYNYPGRFIRHYSAELWSTEGAGSTWNSPTSFNQDVSWSVAAPWAP